MDRKNIPRCIIGDRWKAKRLIKSKSFLRNDKFLMTYVYPTDTGAFSLKELEALTKIHHNVISYRIDTLGIIHKDVLAQNCMDDGEQVHDLLLDHK